MRPLLLLPLLTLFTVLFPVAPGRGEISGNGVPPSGAVPGEVHVARGGSVIVKLSTYGPTLSVKYVIRIPPKAGRLQEITVLDNGDGTVLYQHSGDEESTSDQFTYAARTWRGTSAAALVKVLIDDQPSKLVVPANADFGQVPLGESKTITLKTSNAGGGSATGILSTSAPWQLASKSVYRLAGGGDMEVSVTFTPDHLGPAEGALNFSSGGGMVTTLRGQGVEPFAVAPASVTIAAAAPRQASVNVRNLLTRPIDIQVKAPEPFVVPASLTIAAGATVAVPIRVAAAQLDAADGLLEFTAAGFSASVKASADPLLPKLEVSAPGLTFPSATVGERSTATVVVKNSGERAAEVMASIEPPFQLAKEDRAFPLEPGASRSLALNFAPTALNASAATLAIQASGQRVTVACKAEATLAASTPRPRLANAVMAAETSTDAAASEPNEPDDPEKRSSVPAIKELNVVKVQRTSVLLSWPAFNDPGLRYEVRCLDISLTPDGKDLRSTWIPIPGVQVKVKNGVASAWINGMRSQSFLIAHVITRDAQGLPSAPSPQITARTTGAHWFTLRNVLFAILAVLLGFIVRNKWNARHDRPAGF